MGLAEEGLQEAGRRIGRGYRVIKKLGHGGDGTIYLVEHIPTEQLRAAKLLQSDMPERRRHELDMMKRLRHRALPQIYDVLEEQGDFWLIMEFINGKTLDRLRAEERAGALFFFSIARQLAEALLYLHSRKPPVLHLDIKPSNLMIQSDGTVVLIDFGAAVRTDDRDAGNGSPPCFGTPGFAAPEQWDPGKKPDARADQYGYGAVLYYCLYGQAPGARRKTQEKRPGGSRNAGQGLRWLGWRREAISLIRRCMQEERGRRFPDTASLYHAVKKAERRYLAWKNARRSSAAVLLLLAAMAFAAASLGRSGPEEAAAAAQTKHSYEQLLDQADGLGFAQAVSCYEQAAGMYPSDGAWCERFLGRVESDYVFGLEEEAALKKLMFSVPPGATATEEELMAENSASYGNLAYRIGLLYWYFYEDSGGKRAAAKWFSRAVTWSEGRERTSDNAAWLEAARIHAKIGGYYETIGRQSPDGDKTEKIGTYWEDLTSLWQMDSRTRASDRIQCELAQELLSVLIMQAAELESEGIDTGQLREILTSIGQFLDEVPESEQTAKECRERYQDAEDALERLTEKERGSELVAEKKE